MAPINHLRVALTYFTLTSTASASYHYPLAPRANPSPVSTAYPVTTRPAGCAANDLCPSDENQFVLSQYSGTYQVACNYNFDSGDTTLGNSPGTTLTECLDQCSQLNNAGSNPQCLGANLYQGTCYFKPSADGGVVDDTNCIDSVLLYSNVTASSSSTSSSSSLAASISS